MDQSELFFKKSWHEVQGEIAEACKRAQRQPSEVRLLAVSKKQSLEKIKLLYKFGQRDFGENYLQELVEKKASLSQSCPDIRWHFIGRIQSNKAAKIASCFMVHSVGSIRQAEALNIHAQQVLPVLLQVNLDSAQSRNGFGIDDICAALLDFACLDKLQIRGLMAILPLNSDLPPRFYFDLMRKKRDELETQTGLKLPDLSMGMSADFSEAIAYGATWIRLGTKLFGER